MSRPVRAVSSFRSGWSPKSLSPGADQKKRWATRRSSSAIRSTTLDSIPPAISVSHSRVRSAVLPSEPADGEVRVKWGWRVRQLNVGMALSRELAVRVEGEALVAASEKRRHPVARYEVKIAGTNP